MSIHSTTLKRVGCAMRWTGKKILRLPLYLLMVYVGLWALTLAEALVVGVYDWFTAPPEKKQAYAPPPQQYNPGGSATNFRDMSNNIVAASSGFQNLLPIPHFLSSAMQGSISNGDMQKINAADLVIDSVSVFDGGGAAVYYSPVQARPVFPAEGIASAYYKESGRDSFPEAEQDTVKQVAAEPISTFSIDVDTASYSYARREIKEGRLPQKNAVRPEEFINYFPYDYALPETTQERFRPTVAVYDCPWKKDHKMLHIGIKGYNLQERPRSNFVFLIDTSGSMQSPDKLPMVVNSLKLMLDDLQPEDTVGIVTYAGTAGVALEPVKASDKGAILRVLNSLNAGGSTYGSGGIRAAYDLAEQAFIKDGNNRVILATDGDFNVGISKPSELTEYIEKKREKGVFLSVLGYGQGNYQDSTMQALAQAGNGNAAYISDLDEARKVLVEEAASTLFTIAKDVKIQVDFNPALVQEYRLIGYETRKLKREDFNNDKVDAGEIGAGHTVTAIYEITPAGVAPAVDPARYDKKEQALPAAKSEFSGEWAFLKIRYKKPDGVESNLITRPVTKGDEQVFAKLPDDLRFAASVAGFAQLLKGGRYTGTFNYDDVAEIANAARGKDPFGYRMEFLKLVKLAKNEEGNDK